MNNNDYYTKDKQAREKLLSVDQKAILTMIRLNPLQHMKYLLMPIKTVSVDEEVVTLIINDGVLVIDILDYLNDKYGISPDVTANINIFKTMTETINSAINLAIDYCNEDKKFVDAVEVLEYSETAPDEEFAKYYIMLKAFYDKINCEINPVEKNSDIFQYSYWISVFADNMMNLGANLVLRDEKYW